MFKRERERTILTDKRSFKVERLMRKNTRHKQKDSGRLKDRS